MSRQSWHRRFVWLTRLSDGRLAFMRTVQRRWWQTHGDLRDHFAGFWQYQDIPPILAPLDEINPQQTMALALFEHQLNSSMHGGTSLHHAIALAFPPLLKYIDTLSKPPCTECPLPKLYVAALMKNHKTDPV